MAERAPFTLDDVEIATRDMHDVLIVAQSLLNATVAPLSAGERDALATVVRLGLDRAAVVNMGMDDLREAGR